MQKHETIKRILTIAFLAMVAMLVGGCGEEMKAIQSETVNSIKTLSSVMLYTLSGLTFMFVCVGVFFLVKAWKVWKSMKAEK